MLYIKEAEGSVADVTRRVEEATVANKFGVIEVINLTEKMNAQGVEFEPQCIIVEVCNPVRAKIILEGNMAVSTFLPCRISVYEEDGKVKVATMRPTAILKLFDNPEYMPVAEDVEASIISIIDQACK